VEWCNPSFPAEIAGPVLSPHDTEALHDLDASLNVAHVALIADESELTPGQPQGGMMARVLLAGYIADLMQERDRLLRAAGYEVTVAQSLATAITSIEQESFDVAVLGFSIPEEERNQMAQALKQKSPSTKIIMIYFSNIRNTELADALMHTSAAAEEIVRAVNHILSGIDRSKPA
jgi:CheY-like chemotaxis protein